MANTKNNATAQETRRKLLNAAGEVFAEKGLHGTLIRDITDRAGVNLAAVNYHFKDKLELYLAVMRQIHAVALNDALPLMAEGSPQEGLRAFVAGVMNTLLNPRQPAWYSTLIARELSEPTMAFDDLIEQLIRPTHIGLSAIVGNILGKNAHSEEVTLATCSIVGQCLYYLYGKPMINKIHPKLVRYDNIDKIVDHIVDFSLHALGGMGRTRKPHPKK